MQGSCKDALRQLFDYAAKGIWETGETKVRERETEREISENKESK